MRTALLLYLASVLPLLSATSLPPDERTPTCSLLNAATGRGVDGDIEQEGTYVFHWKDPGCSRQRQTVRALDSLRGQSVRLRLYLNGLFPQGACPSQVHLHTRDDREDRLVGTVDLCRSFSYPETFQFASQPLTLSLAGSGGAEFLLDVEYVSSETTVKRSAGSDWRPLASPGYPVSFPNAMDITYSIAAPSDDWIVELLANDVALGDSGGSTCSGDFLQVFDGAEHGLSWSQRWCRGGRRLLSSGPLVTLKFHSDASVSGRGFSLHYRAVENVQARRTRELLVMKRVAVAMGVVFVAMLCVRMYQWRTERRRELRLKDLVFTLVQHHATSQTAAVEPDSPFHCKSASPSSDAASLRVSLLSDDADFDFQQKTSGPAVPSLPVRGGWSGSVTYVSWALLLAYFLLVAIFLVHCYRALAI